MKQLLLFFIETISFLDICMFAFSVLSATVLVTVCLMDIQKKNTVIYKVLWMIMLASVFFIFVWGYPFYKANNSLIIIVAWIPPACTVPIVHIIMTYRNHKHKTIRGFVSSWARNGFEAPEIIFEMFREIKRAIKKLLWNLGLSHELYFDFYNDDLYEKEARECLLRYEMIRDEKSLDDFFRKIIRHSLDIHIFGVNKKVLTRWKEIPII